MKDSSSATLDDDDNASDGDDDNGDNQCILSFFHDGDPEIEIPDMFFVIHLQLAQYEGRVASQRSRIIYINIIYAH